MEEITFIFSSFGSLPDQHFRGYCFVDSDLVIGSAGAEEYQSESKRDIRPGNDGCYLTINRLDRYHEVGSDHGGYNKIFYYSEGGIWGFSNSLQLLSEHLRENNVSLSRNPALLAQWHIENIFGVQLATFETAYNEINLLPSYSEIHIAEAGLTVKDNVARPKLCYEDTLARCIEVWLSRMATLLLDEDMQCWTQITGGRDSRVKPWFSNTCRTAAGNRPGQSRGVSIKRNRNNHGRFQGRV